MRAVELLNFSADKFSFSPLLAVDQCNKGTCQCVLQYSCRRTTSFSVQFLHSTRNRGKTRIFLFWLWSSNDPSKLDHFAPLMKESFVSQTSEGSLSRPVLDDTDTWTGILSQIWLKRGEEWLLEIAGKNAKIPSGSKLPKTKINIPGPSSIVVVEKWKVNLSIVQGLYVFQLEVFLGRKLQMTISCLFNYMSVSAGKDDDHVAVSKQECIVESSPQFNDSIKQEIGIEPKIPNFVMEQVTCSLDIMTDMDDFARYIEDGSKFYVSEKSKEVAKKCVPDDFVFPKDHNKLCFKPLRCRT